MRILVVEDDNRVAEALAGALRRNGYDVQRAANAAQALNAPPSTLSCSTWACRTATESRSAGNCEPEAASPSSPSPLEEASPTASADYAAARTTTW